MNGKTTAAALALAAMALSACGGSNGQRVNSKICTPFPKAEASASTPAPATGVAVDAASPVDNCLHRWAYSLAPSPDPADAVAEATVAACSSALSRWNQQVIAQPPAGAQGEVQALSLTTGQPTNAVSEHYAFAQARAMFFVVQARAGRCDPPPPPPAAS